MEKETYKSYCLYNDKMSNTQQHKAMLIHVLTVSKQEENDLNYSILSLWKPISAKTRYILQ